VVLTTDVGAEPRRHARWNLEIGAQHELLGAAVALLDQDQDQDKLSVLVTTETGRKIDGNDLLITDVRTGKVLGKAANLRPHAYSSNGPYLIDAYEPKTGDFGTVARIYCTREGGLVWNCSMALPGVELQNRRRVAIALAPCCSFVAVAIEDQSCNLSLHLFAVAKVRAVSKTRLLAIGGSPGLVGLFFRAEHVVLVQASGQVTYYDLRLQKVFEFEFGFNVTAASCLDELWAVIAKGQVFLCQDKFLVP
jgi:hypothetical protein